MGYDELKVFLPKEFARWHAISAHGPSQLKVSFHKPVEIVGMVAQAGTGELKIAAAPKGRYQFTASWFDPVSRQIATANYGTNNDTALTRPATVPARSDNVLVTETFFDANTGRAFPLNILHSAFLSFNFKIVDVIKIFGIQFWKFCGHKYLHNGYQKSSCHCDTQSFLNFVERTYPVEI
ncbi:MAG: hypothetical protein FWH27_13675 [Planctomycetaceae bacterium]|nr:hypothetical protein [Planctomycetaceae bacterium]